MGAVVGAVIAVPVLLFSLMCSYASVEATAGSMCVQGIDKVALAALLILPLIGALIGYRQARSGADAGGLVKAFVVIVFLAVVLGFLWWAWGAFVSLTAEDDSSPMDVSPLNSL